MTARLASILFAFVAACSGSKANEPPPGVSSIPESRAPVHFEYESLDARPVDSASTRGAPTVIAFITTWDLMSQAQVDFLVKMAKNDGDRVHYFVVAMQEKTERELVELYLQKLGVEFPAALADPATIAGGGPFGDVHNVPTVVLLDARGRLVWLHPGLARANEIRAAMNGM